MNSSHPEQPPEDLPISPPPRAPTVIHCDGACTSNGSKDAVGGIGVYFAENSARNISRRLTGVVQTNNRAELTAVLLALNACAADEPVVIMTDSQYTANGCNAWLMSWKRNDWKKADGSAVLNQDLWKEIDAALDARRASTAIKWLPRGKNANADSLAKAAAAVPTTEPASSVAVKADIAAVEGVTDVTIIAVEGRGDNAPLGVAARFDREPWRNFAWGAKCREVSPAHAILKTIETVITHSSRHESLVCRVNHAPILEALAATTPVDRRTAITAVADDANERDIMLEIAETIAKNSASRVVRPVYHFAYALTPASRAASKTAEALLDK